MDRLYEILPKIFLSLFLAAFLAACTGPQAPQTTQPAPVTQQVITVPTETLPPLPTGTPAPAPTDTLSPPADTPSASGATPTPELEDMTVRVITSTSPDGDWKAEALLADPYNQHGTFVGEMDYARLTVFRTDGSQEWVPYEEWSGTGLGDSYLGGFHWSGDGRYLYFTHSGVADGCGKPFVTNLRRVDLQDGGLIEIPLEGLGLDVITISPEADRMAYPTEEGLLLYDLESGETRTLAYDWPEGFDTQVGEYTWAPDRQYLVFTLSENFCGPPEEAQTTIKVINLDSGETGVLLDQESGLLQVTGWPEPERLQVVDRDGQKYFLSIESGELVPDETPPDPVAPATRVLNDFLNALHWGASDSSQYEQAAAIYGGSYDILVEMNPDVDPAAHVTLLRNACRVNGLQCLRLREVLSAETVASGGDADEVRLTVNLMNPDGSVFALGPCCGEETGEPQTEFVFTIRQDESGEFKVLDLPPYMP